MLYVPICTLIVGSISHAKRKTSIKQSPPCFWYQTGPKNVWLWYVNLFGFHELCHWRRISLRLINDFNFWLDEKCENKLRNDICESYQRKGYCIKKKWMDWMAKSCKKTCNFCYSVCQDMHGFQCEKKAITEDCNDKEMMKNCPKACGLCWLCSWIANRDKK